MRIAALCAIGLAASIATADQVDLFVFENADGVDVSNLDINVEVVDAGGGAIEFVFSNDSSIDSFVSSIYVESTDFSTAAMANGAIGDESGATFTPPATPEFPPGSISGSGGAWGGNLFSADKTPGSGTGIDVGDYVTVEMDLINGYTYGDVIDALGEPVAFRFAAHVQGINGSSVWVTNGPIGEIVPLPPAAFAGAGLLALMGGVRIVRRR
jgi:hypothetical protein